MNRRLAITILVCLAGVLAAADISGKYKTTIEAPDGNHILVFDLKVSGDKLTGTVTADTAQAGRPIQDGKVQGNAVAFVWETDYQGGPVRLVCRGSVVDGDLKLSMGTEDGGWSTEFTAKKSD